MRAVTSVAAALLTAVIAVFLLWPNGGSKTVTVTIHRDPAPTPAEKQLPVTPSKGEFDAPPPNSALAPSAKPPPAVAEKQANQVDDGTYDTSGVLSGATAQPARKVCYTPRNGGPRSISSIGLMVAHVTVSLNVTGTRDGDNLCEFFRSVQASPNWTVDNEGNSWQNVPLDRVPWTQAWYNRVSCSIEYIGSTGRAGEGPAQWTDIQLKEGGRLFAQCAKKAGIPIRSGAVSLAGSVLRTGLITHQELGPKGGNHSDPGPFWNRQRQLYWISFWANGGGCRTKCQAAAKLRSEHIQVHHSIRARGCSPTHPRAQVCRDLARRNSEIHRTARETKVKL